jgi:hypothetical protein
VHIDYQQYGGETKIADVMTFGDTAGTRDVGADICTLIVRLQAAGLDHATTTAAVGHAHNALAALADPAAGPERPAAAMSRVHRVLAGVVKAAPLASAAATIATGLLAGQ